MKILGLRKSKEKYGTIYKNDWMEFCTGWRKLNFSVSPASYFDNRAQIAFSLGWGQFYISIPFIRSKYDECDPPTYGFYFYSVYSWFPTSFVIRLGRNTKFFYMPWDLNWVRTSILRTDGEWEHETSETKLGTKNSKDFHNKKKWEGIIWEETHPYKYVLKNGTVQERTATIRVEEREWRPRWLKWTSAFSKKRRTIDVEFNEEVGERSGSWKGGTLGCGYELMSNETPLECLRRMERERSFT